MWNKNIINIKETKKEGKYIRVRDFGLEIFSIGDKIETRI